MSSAVMKSPAKQGFTPIASVYYKCDDCGDVSHSQASLSLHRSVCHTSSKPRSVEGPEVIEQNSDAATGTEQVEKNTDLVAKTDQIAESCECPKCGEHLLLLREHSFNCALCEFHDTDQSRFFVHLKEHYEANAVLKFVEPGSVIIEQVVDGASDLDTRAIDNLSDGNCRKDSAICNDAGNRDEPSDLDEPDDRDDPEYVPGNDESDDDAEEMEKRESKKVKPKLGISWKSSPDKAGAEKKLNFVKSADDKVNNTKAAKSKLGISWDLPKEKGALKKLSYVKTPCTSTTAGKTTSVKPSSSWTPVKDNSYPQKSSVDKTSPTLGQSITIKEEPVWSNEPSKKEVSTKGSTKWVRWQDIKLESPYGQSNKHVTRPYAPSLTKLLTSKGPSPMKGTKAPKESSPSKRLKPTEEPEPGGSTEKSSTEDGRKKKSAKKAKETKVIPRPEKKMPVCGHCKRIFATATSLRVHMRIHTGEKNYTCDQCGKAFTQWSTCAQHIEAIHSGVKKYTCEFCGASFARNSGLRLHRRIHTGENLHYCNICGKGFRCKSYMDRHRTFHTGEKRYKCEFCFKTFRTSTDMKRHRNSVHFGLGNVSLTAAKELLVTRMDGIRTPQRQPPPRTVVQRYVNEDSTGSEDSQELIQATTIITGTTYEL